MVRVAIVDDQDLIRIGLQCILSAHREIDVVGLADSGQDAVRLVRMEKPDVLLMDLSMPGLDSIETTKRIIGEGLETGIILLTMHTAEEYAARALQAGAQGFLSKAIPEAELLKAIHTVASGECYLSAELSEVLSKRYIRHGAYASPIEMLSDRELQVLKHLAEGSKSRDIAKELHLSVKTIDTYRARLQDKLDLHTMADIVRFALRSGVIENVW
jgi:two-component system invasion response regulator UvrY